MPPESISYCDKGKSISYPLFLLFCAPYTLSNNSPTKSLCSHACCHVLESSSSRSEKLEWRCGVDKYTNTQETYLREQMLILFMFHPLPSAYFPLSFVYHLKQEFLCKEKITSHPQVTYFPKTN